MPKGRPNKYEQYVAPQLDKIEKMALVMTEEQIAKTLGVGYATFRRYKAEHEQLRTALKRGRKDLVYDLKSALIKKAMGYSYTEVTLIKENGVVVREETKLKQTAPDVAAINLLLKNYDREDWANDPQMIAIRKKELELRERQLEMNEW